MKPVRERLAGWSREELVERMVRRDHALLGMLDAPPAGRGAPVDVAHLARRVELAFQPAIRGTWREAAALAPVMQEMASLGYRHLRKDEVESATLTFRAVAQGILRHIGDISEDESEVGIHVDECMRGLAACLEAADDRLRPVVLDAILEVAIEGGPWGLGGAGDELLAERATTEERAELAARVTRRRDEASSEWDRGRLGRLALRMSHDGSAEERVTAAGASGARLPLIEALLAAHRPYRADRVLEDAEDAELLPLTEIFVEHGYPTHAYGVLAGRADRCALPHRVPLLRWLLEHTEQDRAGRRKGERWAVALFVAAPSLEHWELMRAWVPFDRRMKLRRELELREHWRLVTQICIVEGRHRWAVRRFRAIRDKTVEDRRMGGAIAEPLRTEKPKLAAGLWLQVAIHLAHEGAVEEAVDQVMRGHAALVAAPHPVLARRHLATFRSRTEGLDAVACELRRATNAAMEIR